MSWFNGIFLFGKCHLVRNKIFQRKTPVVLLVSKVQGKLSGQFQRQAVSYQTFFFLSELKMGILAKLYFTKMMKIFSTLLVMNKTKSVNLKYLYNWIYCFLAWSHDAVTDPLLYPQSLSVCYTLPWQQRLYRPLCWESSNLALPCLWQNCTGCTVSWSVHTQTT